MTQIFILILLLLAIALLTAVLVRQGSGTDSERMLDRLSTELRQTVTKRASRAAPCAAS